MRKSLIGTAVALLLLTACDKKKSAPTETGGLTRELRPVPSATAAPAAVATPAEIG